MQVFNRLAPYLDEKGIDALFISDYSSRYYLTKQNMSDGGVLLKKDGGVIIADFRYIELARSNKNFTAVLQEKGIYPTLKEQCNNLNIKTLGFDEEKTSVKEFSLLSKELEGVKLFPCGEIIKNLRKIKTEDEIVKIQKAQSITDSCFTHILKFIKEGVTEKDLCCEAEYYMKKQGADGFSFSSKFLSGKNTSLPHGDPTNKKIANGEFVLMDFGAVYEGLCSDMTRTVAVSYADEKMKKVYNIVLEAQKAALKEIKEGKTGYEIDKLARDIIEKNGFSKNFGHGLGHGVGYLVHEEPRLSPLYKEPIFENSVVTVEPGIYLEGEFGVRIEDLVVVTKDGHKNLTKSPKELLVL